MTDIQEPGLGDEWDLGEVLQERPQPTTSVVVYLSEEASYTKAKLTEAHAKATGEEAERIEGLLAEADAALEACKYTIHLTAVPSRMREDISSKALARFPIKPDPIWGRDDPTNMQERIKYENSLIWLAQITGVTNPRGQSKETWDQPSMDKFCEALPTTAQKAVDSAIGELTKAAEKFTVGSANLDF